MNNNDEKKLLDVEEPQLSPKMSNEAEMKMIEEILPTSFLDFLSFLMTDAISERIIEFGEHVFPHPVKMRDFYIFSFSKNILGRHFLIFKRIFEKHNKNRFRSVLVKSSKCSPAAR